MLSSYKLKNFLCLILSINLLFMLGCSNKQPKSEGNKTSDTQTQSYHESSPQAVNDKYVGSWIDINHDPNDTSEIFTITKLHDYEYQVGSLKGDLKKLINGAEYLSVWSEEYGAEMQFIFDHYTKHLRLRTPFFSKELRNIKE